MMKCIILFLIIFLNYKYAIGRDVGETEITTDDGIEVFQEEKYYLLKKNVEIISDEFELNGDLVKIYFEKDLYDIQELIASTNVNFKSNIYNIRGKGHSFKFNIKNRKINVLINKNETKINLLSGEKIDIMLNNQEITIYPKTIKIN